MEKNGEEVDYPQLKKPLVFYKPLFKTTKLLRPIQDDQKNLALHFVLLGFGIKTAIKSGENRGKTLPQEFVVLKHLKMNSQNASWSFDLPARN